VNDVTNVSHCGLTRTISNKLIAPVIARCRSIPWYAASGAAAASATRNGRLRHQSDSAPALGVRRAIECIAWHGTEPSTNDEDRRHTGPDSICIRPPARHTGISLFLTGSSPRIRINRTHACSWRQRNNKDARIFHSVTQQPEGSHQASFSSIADQHH